MTIENILLANNDNVFLETSGNTYPFVDYVDRHLGASKIIFGSDFLIALPLLVLVVDRTTRIIYTRKRAYLKPKYYKNFKQEKELNNNIDIAD